MTPNYNPLCIVKNSEGKGRGVFAAHAIAKQTTVESSPVLLFGKEEYEQHGRFTIVDHYAFNWKNGSKALALGLGTATTYLWFSKFPNLSYAIDPSNDLIHYTATRDIEPDEELCIYYGSKLWFDPVESVGTSDPQENEDGWGGLSSVNLNSTENGLPSFFHGSVDAVVPEEDLPFERFKPLPDEETAGTIRTLQAWAVDVPDPRSIGPMLKWLRRSELDATELGHLKRVRKHGDKSTFLLSVSSEPPSLPEDISLPSPFLVTVPSSVALTLTSLSLKSALWPTIYAPRRKGEVQEWSRGKARWAWEAMNTAVQEALRRQEEGEGRSFYRTACLPVAAYVPVPYETSDSNDAPPAFMAHDTRRMAAHPSATPGDTEPESVIEPGVPLDRDEEGEANGDSPRNGTNYLLTSQTLFTTHEPCIMCSMALLHSRVKEIVYLVPMPKTGGCGGLTCVPALPGVNHRFGICRWKEGMIEEAGLHLEASVDA
ncbi:Histone-lysine methyltransferase Set7 [Mycena sanguinolenta]|uniref:Histone-lysine methyltransferase Set7 n=1 Tax=Mycena sanguinolenta TaxID=230812 RepID=A0A8H7CSU7_9AGAR|nr:Histone-lysine methyltransferase Set7 [Mycena sanguinolenta]